MVNKIYTTNTHLILCYIEIATSLFAERRVIRSIDVRSGNQFEIESSKNRCYMIANKE